MTTFGFIIDNRKCIGCHACTVACKQEHELPIGVNRTWVKYVEKGEFPNTRRIFSVQRCNHCADAPCVEICPVTALFQRKDGIVDFDGQRCIGCKACMQACPYDAIYIHPDDNTAAKCNYCAHRVVMGLYPPCVNVCPEHAIIAGDMDDPASEISVMLARHQVQVRKPEKGTRPKVFYIEGDAASLNPTYSSTPPGYLWSEIPRRVYQISPPRLEQAEAEARRVYDQGQSHQDTWGWKVGTYLWTKSLSAGIPMAMALLGFFTSFSHLLIALIFLGITTTLLILDLRRPERFLRVITRPQWRSWLTRGAYILILFGLLLTLNAALLLLDFGESIQIPFVIMTIFAAASAAYSAFLFWQAKGRDFWQSPLLVVHLLVMALLAGSSILIMTIPQAAILFVASLIAHGLLIFFDLAAVHSTQDAKTSARYLYRKNPLFWIGVIIAGILLPLGLYSVSVFAAFSALIGLLIYEILWIKAGQVVPLS